MINISPGDFIKQSLINIVTLFLIFLCTQTAVGSKAISQIKQEVPLRQILERFRKTEEMNFVYSDKIIGDILVDTKSTEKLSPQNFKTFLQQYNLSYQKYGENTYVLFRNEVKKVQTNFEKVVTNQEIAEADSSQLIIKPILLSKQAPPYPRTAVKEGIEGSVRIKYLVNKSGEVKNSEVLATSGYSILDSAAKEFVYTLKYTPAEKDGKPHSTWMSMLFRYILERDSN